MTTKDDVMIHGILPPSSTAVVKQPHIRKRVHQVYIGLDGSKRDRQTALRAAVSGRPRTLRGAGMPSGRGRGGGRGIRAGVSIVEKNAESHGRGVSRPKQTWDSNQ